MTMVTPTDLSRALLVALSCLIAGSAWPEARVEMFSPSGYAKDVRQVTVRFSEAMVALGDPGRLDPFSVDCEIPGNGRWIDERNWVYDFDYDVPGAVRCRFQLRNDVRTLAGEAVQTTPEYAFHTGGPAILRRLPLGERADERQVFLLALDAVADPDSIRKHVHCRIGGSQATRPIDLVQGRERSRILDALEAADTHYVWELVESASSHLPAAGPRETRTRALERIEMVRCRDPLPGGSDVELIWGAGVAGPNGMATTRERSVSFSVRPDFQALLLCADKFEDRCAGGVHIRFTSPVSRELADGIRLVDGNGNVVEALMADKPYIARIDYPGAFEDQTSYRAELLAPITDVDGRALTNASAFPATIRLGRLPAGASFGGGIRVVERDAGAVAPVLLRRVEEPLSGRSLRVAEDSEIVAWMRRVWNAPDAEGDEWVGSASGQSVFEAVESGVAFTFSPGSADHPYRVAGVPLQGPGFHVVELELPAAGSLPRRYVAGLTVVTGLAVHLHRAKESSVVWVTGLSDGNPVESADIAITDVCTGETVARAATDADGLARIPGALPRSNACTRYGYLVTARKDGDVAASMSRSRGHRSPRPTIVAHAVLDRAIFQPGETVSMKLVVRLGTSEGLVVPPGLPTKVNALIEQYWTDERHEASVDLDEDGTALASFDLPASARLGWYTVYVEFDGGKRRVGDFRVERFRVGTMRGAILGPEGPLLNTGSVPITLSVEHLAGGGAASLPVSVRTTVRPWFYYWEYPEPPEPWTASATLDSKGTAPLDVPLPRLERKGVLDVEMDYQDANGQRKTASKRIELWPAAIDLAVRSDETRPMDKRIVVKAVGLDGQAAPGVPVEASIYYPRHYDDRRLPGGFRARKWRSESPLITTCSGHTDASGSFGCTVPEESPDAVLVEATGWDAHGNAARRVATTGYWSDARRPKWLEVDSERTYAVGETVPVSLNLPFPEATLLVTVHREGVLAAFVEHVTGPQAVINVPVRQNYAPNVEISVLAIRPRVLPAVRLETPQPVAPDPPRPDSFGRNPSFSHWRYTMSTPGGPIHRLGTVDVRVALDAHALSVNVEPDRDIYRTRDTARVRIAVLGPDGRPRPDAEVALVTVDEGLLKLSANETWDILKAMMAERYARLDTSTSMQRLSRTFDLIPSGTETVIVTGSFQRSSGFGVDPLDEQPTRERFDPLLLWRGRLAMDEHGTAVAEIPLNDLLTSFRIVAVATAGEDLFGTGEATVRTTQDLIVHAGLPEVVREGDRFDAMFTVRNASEKSTRVNVAAEAEGLGKLRNKMLRLRPGQSREVSWPVVVPTGVDHLAWKVTAEGRAAVDRMASRQSVEPAVPVRVQQATLTQLAASRSLPVTPPQTALPGRGGVKVSLQPSLADNLGAVREAMSRYRYSCLEQDVSVAVVLDDEARWSAAMDDAEASLDPDGLLRFFPSDRLRGSPVLTAYVLTIADAAGKRVPDNTRNAMIKGLEDYVSGRTVRNNVVRAVDSHLRRLSALAALARHDAVDGAMLDAAEVDVESLPTSALLDWIDILDRLDARHEQRQLAKSVLRSRLNLQGTTMGFSTEHADRLWWLMVSTDGNAARAILSVLDDPDWRDDLPRMMRGLFGRQQRGRWQTTIANAWGTLAATAFGAVFEAEPITGASNVRMGETQHRARWPNPGDAATAEPPQPIELPWSSARTLALAHEGTGAPWSLVELHAAVPLTEPTQRGYRIVRRVDAVERQNARRWSRGDIAQVILEIDADADMTWVVVDDPLPPGAVVLGSGLGDDSSILGRTYVRGDRWPVFTERDFDRYRAYYRYVPKGRTTLRYNVRYNTSGTFQLPPTRVEAMYAPEMHAELPLEVMAIH